MVIRDAWVRRIQEAWQKAPILWLTGVRRSGKTTLCHSFPEGRYLNCDLTQSATLLQEPEAFYKSVQEPIVIFDEIHQLPDPSRILKIGADVFPHLKILATGSSTLAATQKFRDSLTGRKRSVELLPVLYGELETFGVKDLRRRLFRGGLPPILLASEPDEGFYAEWMDSYFARDVQELFRVAQRTGFLRLLELLLRQSGGLMEATSLARACGLSRPTVLNYLNIFEMTHVVHIVRPYHGGGKQEILHQPKIYGFDTGFVRYTRGWGELREGDCGMLWEHLVLDVLLTLPPEKRIYFWRDKQKREVDFVLRGHGQKTDAIECKWTPSAFDPGALRAFRQLHPHGGNWVISPSITTPYTRRTNGLDIHYVNIPELIRSLQK